MRTGHHRGRIRIRAARGRRKGGRVALQARNHVQRMGQQRPHRMDFHCRQIVEFGVGALTFNEIVHRCAQLGGPHVPDVLDGGADLLEARHILRCIAEDEFRLDHVMFAGHLRKVSVCKKTMRQT